MSLCFPNRCVRLPGAGRAFTLVELLTVLSIIIILGGILIPVVGRAREASRKAKCVGNLRRIAEGALIYVNENKGMTPRTQIYTFMQQLWPYVYPERGAIQNLNDEKGTTKGLPAVLADTIFECPGAKLESSPPLNAVRSYGMNPFLVPSASGRDVNGVKLSLVSLPAQAVFFGDSKNSSGFYPASCNPRHGDLMNIAYVDGHVAAIALTDQMTVASAPTSLTFWTGEP